MMHWFSDTLSKRLFALMWLALVASHIAGFAAVHSLGCGKRRDPWFGQRPEHLPVAAADPRRSGHARR